MIYKNHITWTYFKRCLGISFGKGFKRKFCLRYFAHSIFSAIITILLQAVDVITGALESANLKRT